MPIDAIEIWDRMLVRPTGWRDLRDGKKASDSGDAALSFEALMAEEHHRYYGRPWCVGRSYFDFLTGIGLDPAHSVLDFGCGAGRLGIWLIPYLGAGQYVGIDQHFQALDAFARYEIPLHRLERFRPRLVLDGALKVARLNRKFDWICDLFVSFHLPEDRRRSLYRQFARVLNKGGRIVVPHKPGLSADQLAELGLRTVHDQIVPSEFLAGWMPDKKANDHWHLIAIE